MTTTTSAVTHQPVRNIPIAGFDFGSPESRQQKFADETVQEVNRYAELHGVHPTQVPLCQQTHPTGRRGTCTRVAGFSKPDHHDGMHIAGNRDYVAGAW